jgi:HEAT repeat protein
MARAGGGRWGLAALALAAVLAAGCEAFMSGEELAAEQTRRWTEQDLRALEGPDPVRRAEAARALGRRRVEAAVPALTRALRDPDARVRAGAADGLASLGEPARPAVPALREALAAEPDPAAALALGWALRKHQADVRPWVERIRPALRAPEALTRYNAALLLYGLVDGMELYPVVFATIGTGIGQGLSNPESVLGEIVGREVRFVPLLLDGTARGSTPQRMAAALLLSRYDPPPPPAVPAVVRLLGEPEVDLRRRGAAALARMGRPARAATPELVRALRDPDEEVRANAAWALGNVSSVSPLPATAPALLAALGDPSPKVRGEAARALGELRQAGAGAVPALIRLLREDPDGEVRAWAAHSLGWMGPAGAPAVAPLRAALQDPVERVRARAAWALQQLAPR